MSCNKKLTAIGGGTGLSTVLGGLRKYFHDMTAIVTVADDGGSSGKLRTQLGMLPPGDIRNCLCALANSELKEVMNYRFTEGELKGHPFGNLCIAAFNGVSSNFVEAVDKMNRILETDGLVVPVTNENISLCAYLENGDIIWGESSIGKRIGKEKIDRIELRPKCPAAVDKAVEKIIASDIILFGPGSLYTSIIPNLLVDGICDAIKKSKAKKIYVCNLMTQPGETIGYSAYEHMKAIEKHTYPDIMDYIIANNENIKPVLMERYANEGAEQVRVRAEDFEGAKIVLKSAGLVSDNEEYLRHDVEALAKIIMEIVGD